MGSFTCVFCNSGSEYTPYLERQKWSNDKRNWLKYKIMQKYVRYLLSVYIMRQKKHFKLVVFTLFFMEEIIKKIFVFRFKFNILTTWCKFHYTIRGIKWFVFIDQWTIKKFAWLFFTCAPLTDTLAFYRYNTLF